MKRAYKALLIVAACIPLSGCGESKEAKVIYDESAMEKYRSTPEQIAAAQKEGSNAQRPSAADIKALQAQEAAAAAANNGN